MQPAPKTSWLAAYTAFSWHASTYAVCVCEHCIPFANPIQPATYIYICWPKKNGAHSHQRGDRLVNKNKILCACVFVCRFVHTSSARFPPCAVSRPSQTAERRATKRIGTRERERGAPQIYIPDSIDPAGLIRVRTPYSIFYCVILYLIFYARARSGAIVAGKKGEVIVFCWSLPFGTGRPASRRRILQMHWALAKLPAQHWQTHGKRDNNNQPTRAIAILRSINGRSVPVCRWILSHVISSASHKTRCRMSTIINCCQGNRFDEIIVRTFMSRKRSIMMCCCFESQRW